MAGFCRSRRDHPDHAVARRAGRDRRRRAARRAGRAAQHAAARSASAPLTKRFSGGSDTLDILELRAAGELASRAGGAAEAGRDHAPGPGGRRRRRATFRLTDRDDQRPQMDMSRVDATVDKDTVEVWRITNEDGIPHSFHIHDVQFQVLTVDGRAAPPHLGGWKDTVYLPPQQPVRDHRPLRRLHRPEHAVHVPLPCAPP